MVKDNKIILHSDMNSFYASVELIKNSQFKGLPLAVGGDEDNRHGIVLAKTIEAKRYGIVTGESLLEARKKCPNLVVLPPNYEKYLEYSKRAQKIYYDYTNQVEPYGMDECWLDITGSTNLFGNGFDIANEIRNRIKDELQLTVSIGVSFNKVFAKLGSDMKKPDAVTVIKRSNFKKIVWPLKCEEMIMVGKSTKRKLNNIGIKTLGELANTNVEVLEKLLGINGKRLWLWSNGIDNSEVRDYYYKPPPKTIGHGITTKEDLTNDDEVRAVFQELVQDVSRQLLEQGYLATGVAINIRSNKLKRTTYQMKLQFPTNSSLEMTNAAMELFKNYNWENNLRTITIRAINLINDNETYQVNILDDITEHKKNMDIEYAMYLIRKRYGEKSITYCNALNNNKMPTDEREKVILPFNFIQG